MSSNGIFTVKPKHKPFQVEFQLFSNNLSHHHKLFPKKRKQNNRITTTKENKRCSEFVEKNSICCKSQLLTAVISRCHDWPFELSFVHCQLPSPTTWASASASTTVTLCSYDLTSCVVDITNYDQQTRWSQSSSSWSPRASSRFVGISEWMTMIRYSGFPKQVYILSELSPHPTLLPLENAF